MCFNRDQNITVGGDYFPQRGGLFSLFLYRRIYRQASPCLCWQGSLATKQNKLPTEQTKSSVLINIVVIASSLNLLQLTIPTNHSNKSTQLVSFADGSLTLTQQTSSLREGWYSMIVQQNHFNKLPNYTSTNYQITLQLITNFPNKQTCSTTLQIALLMYRIGSTIAPN